VGGAPAAAVNAEVGGIGRSVCLVVVVVVVVESEGLENGDEKREGEVLRDPGGEKKETMESQENGIVGDLFFRGLLYSG
jgi:hypothetical protein